MKPLKAKESYEFIDERSYKNSSAISQISRVDGIIEKRKHISLTSKCNNNCIFCFSETNIKKNRSFEEIKADLEKGVTEGCTYLVLSGGEPTIHPDFLKIVKTAKQMGYRKIKVISNGRMFAYQRFLDKSIDFGVSTIAFSIHGHNAELNDYLTDTKGSFKQSLLGLNNSINKGVETQVNIVLNKANLGHFREILDFLIANGVKKMEILNLVPEGNAWKNKEKLFFKIEDKQDELKDIFAYLKSKNIEFELNRFKISHFPEFINKEYYKLKKFNELSIKKEEFINILKTHKPLRCSGERCSYCFIEEECNRIKKEILDNKKILKEDFDFYNILDRIIKIK